MSEAALASPFGRRIDPGRFFSVVLAALVHLVLFAVLLFGVRWQNRPPEAMEVELWREPPPPPAPVVVEPPKPAPVLEPEPPKPEPVIEKPEIAIKQPPPPPPKPEARPKPKPEPVAKPKPKPEPKVDPMAKAREQQAQRKMQQELAQEQLALASDQEKQKIRDQLARDAAASHSKALDEYIARIRAKVRSNWILPLELKGNPEATFNVVQLPNGEVLSVQLVRSSGIPAYDQAVERAILRSSPLPKPTSESVFSRELRLTFRPKD